MSAESERTAAKPDYVDSDWSALIADRTAKWAGMWRELAGRGITRTPLWENSADVPGFDPALGQPEPAAALWPVRPGRGTVIVCAGGAFLFKSSNEACDVAEAFYKKGFNAAVLDYRTLPYPFEATGADALRCLRLLRFRAGELGLDPNRLAIGGFSAGGMLTSYVQCHFDAGDPGAADPVERVSSRPDAAFSVYGAFPAYADPRAAAPKGEILHTFSYDEAREAAKNRFAPNLRHDAAPIFLAQTDADDPKNLLDMAAAYTALGVQNEFHLFHGGPHGGALYDGSGEDTPNFPHTAHWFELACEWFALQGF